MGINLEITGIRTGKKNDVREWKGMRLWEYVFALLLTSNAVRRRRHITGRVNPLNRLII